MLSQELMDSITKLFTETEQLLYEVRHIGKPDHLTSLQYNMIELLYVSQEKCLSDIAHCLYLSLPNASREVKKLQELGVVEKRSSKTDKRTLYIDLTLKGRTLMEQAFGHIYAYMESKLGHLTEEEQHRLNENIVGVVKELGI